jgi:hypothetical protein
MKPDGMFRSLLFVPGDSRRKLDHAMGSAADALVIDWEDSVAEQQKAEARSMTIEFLRTVRGPHATIWIRVNGIGTSAFTEDCEALRSCHAAGVVLGKCDSADQVRGVDAMLRDLEAAHAFTVCPLLETPRAVIDALAIASSSSRVVALGFGAEDFSACVGVRSTEDEIELLYARSAMLMEGKSLPTSILVVNDFAAMGVLERLKIAGISVPGDISIIGYDDLGQKVSPPLTTVRVDLHEVGRLAADALFRKMNGDEVGSDEYVVPVDLVVRGSTAAVAAAR